MIFRIILLWSAALAFTVTWACPDGEVSVTVDCTEGAYGSEVMWEILQHAEVVLSGQGGDTKNACLQGGNVTVVGWDTYGDGWNGAKLKVVGEDRTVFFPEWSGPSSSDGKEKVQKWFTLACPPGFFFQSVCTSCAGGRFGTLPNIHTSESLACPYTSSTCPSGYYCSGTGGEATPCPAGKYGDRTGQTASSACSDCETGTIALEKGTSQCSLCSKGSYCPTAISTMPCPAGKYGDRSGQVTFSACSDCDAGKVTMDKGMTKKSQCSLCPRGTYCLRGMSSLPCPAGKYGDRTGLTACKSCSAGSCDRTKNCAKGDYTLLRDCPLFRLTDDVTNSDFPHETRRRNAIWQSILFSFPPLLIFLGLYRYITRRKSSASSQSKVRNDTTAPAQLEMPNQLEMVRVEADNTIQNVNVCKNPLNKWGNKIPLVQVLQHVEPAQARKAMGKIAKITSEIKETKGNSAATNRTCSLIVLVGDRAFHWDQHGLFEELKTCPGDETMPVHLLFEMNTPPNFCGHKIGLRLKPVSWPIYIVGINNDAFWGNSITFPVPMNDVPELKGVMVSVQACLHVGDASILVQKEESELLRYTRKQIESKASFVANGKNKDGDTRLHIACRKGFNSVVKLLLSHPKIDVNVMDRNRKVPLRIAIEQNHREVVKLLLVHPSTKFRHFHDELLVKLLLQLQPSQAFAMDRGGKVPLEITLLEQISSQTNTGQPHYYDREVAKLLLENPSTGIRGVKDKLQFNLTELCKSVSPNYNYKAIRDSKKLWTTKLNLHAHLGLEQDLSDAMDVSIPTNYNGDTMIIMVPLTLSAKLDERGYLFNTDWETVMSQNFMLERNVKRFCIHPPSKCKNRLQNTGTNEHYSPLYDKYGVNAALNGKQADVLDNFFLRNTALYFCILSLIAFADMISDISDWLSYHRSQCIHFSPSCNSSNYINQQGWTYDRTSFKKDHAYSMTFNLYNSRSDNPCYLRFLSPTADCSFRRDELYGYVNNTGKMSMFSLINSPFATWYDYIRMFALVATLALTVSRLIVVLITRFFYKHEGLMGTKTLFFPCVECSAGSECSWFWFSNFEHLKIPSYLTVYLQWLIVQNNFLQLACNICFEDGPSLAVKIGEIMNEDELSTVGWVSFVITCLLFTKTMIQCVAALVRSIRARACLMINSAAVAGVAASDSTFVVESMESAEVFETDFSCDVCDGNGGDCCDCYCDVCDGNWNDCCDCYDCCCDED